MRRCLGRWIVALAGWIALGEGGRTRCRLWRREARAARWTEGRVPLDEPRALFLPPGARALTWRSAARDELRVLALRRRRAVLRASVLSCAALAAAGLAGRAAAVDRSSPAADGRWRLVATRRLQQHAIHAGFRDLRSGISVGAHGMVFATRDGGATWEEAVNHTGTRNALELHAQGFGWHAGNVEVRRSFDGGRTWYLAADFRGDDADPALHLSFADEVRGFVATRARLAITSDGGLAWTEVRPPAEAGEIAAVSLALGPIRPGMTSLEMNAARRPIVGRLLDAAGRLWVTADGGASWAEEESPLAATPFHVAGSAPAVALRFTPAGDGVLAAFVPHGAGWRCRVYRRAAGARRWAEESVPLSELGSLFVSADARLLTWKSFDRDELRLYAPPARSGAAP